MSEIIGKYIIFFDIDLKTNLHIGAGDSNIDTDALCMRNSSGSLTIAGSTIAGIIRCTLERIFGEGDDLIEKFFGYVKKDQKSSQASFLCFEDAVIKNSRSPHPDSDIRDGVGINRGQLSAQEQCKYDKETVYKGSIFPCTITINYTESNKYLLNKLIDYIKIAFYNINIGLVPIGGGSSRGLGYCKIESAKYCNLNLYDKSHLNDFLLNDFYDIDSALQLKDENNVLYFKDFNFNEKITFQHQKSGHFKYCIKIHYNLKATEPLLISGPRTNDEDVDFQFVKTDGKYIIPGSSVKGPLRSHGEKILRTMNLAGICDPVSDSCFIQKKDLPCFACRLFGFSGQKSKILFSDLAPLEEPKVKYFDHNQIDRFTGGTIENALFDEKLIFDATFQGEILIENPEIVELKLLIHIFKDLYLEDIRIGYGKTKGYGKVKGIITKLELFKTPASTLNGKSFDDYNIIFTHEECIYQIMELDDIYNTGNKESYKDILDEIKKHEWTR